MLYSVVVAYPLASGDVQTIHHMFLAIFCQCDKLNTRFTQVVNYGIVTITIVEQFPEPIVVRLFVFCCCCLYIIMLWDNNGEWISRDTSMPVCQVLVFGGVK